ncbi:MAG: hypothetical protein GXP25_01100 [Planctomycetes bacterium]|nr:hypothetical protein [Planctomycetota bacterium]
MKFSIGFNGERTFRVLADKYREHITDVYFSPPFTPSGRGLRGNVGEYVYSLVLHEFLQFARDTGIQTNLLLNALCAAGKYGTVGQATRVVNAVSLHMRNYGTTSVTVVSPIDGELLKRKFPDLKIHTSVNMFIRNLAQARAVSHFADVIILDRNVNRDLETIRTIREDTGKEIRILANESCLLECMNRIQHFNRIAHDHVAMKGRHLPCSSRYFSDTATLLKAPIIRPEDLHHYNDLADTTKLATRNMSSDKLECSLAAYTSGHFEGSLFDITESNGMAAYLTLTREQNNDRLEPCLDNTKIPDDFFAHVTQCDKMCDRCQYCDRVAAEAFRLRPVPAGATDVPKTA